MSAGITSEAGFSKSEAELSSAAAKNGSVKPATGLALVLFGSPGSGKGTQSKLLMQYLGIPQISTGDMLRDHIRRGDEVGKAISGRMHAGLLVPDELVNKLVAERLAEADSRSGFILDGYPRTRQQAEVLVKLLEKLGMEEVVIHLVVDYNVICARLTQRRQCPKCGTLYNSASRPSRVPGICDLDGETLEIREDDRESVVRERLDAYERQTRPLIEYFRETGRRLYEIEASYDKPPVVFEKITKLLQ